MLFFKIALLNIRKHLKRSLLIIFAILISVLVMELVSGMLNGIRESFFENLIGSDGHIQIHAAGFEDRLNPLSLDYILDNPAGLIDEIKTVPGVEAAEPILTYGGLLYNADYPEKSIEMLGLAVREDTVFYPNVKRGIKEGRFLPEGRGVAVSEETAGLLNLEVNDNVIVLTVDNYGVPCYRQYPVTAVFNSNSSSFDNNNFLIGHASAQEQLDLTDSTVEIRVRLTDREQAAAVKEQIALLLGDHKYEIKTWREIHGSLLTIINLMDFFMMIMNLFVVIVAATVITNAILMNIFERFREFGTMRAIGLKKRQLLGFVLAEGGLEGFFGSLAGIGIGIPFVLSLQANGLDLGALTDAFQMGMGNIFYFHWSPVYSFLNLIFGICIALLSSFYAGLIGSRSPIVDILKTA